MRLPGNALVAQEKLTEYLLRWRPENDKSAFLAQAGYTLQNAGTLMADIREHMTYELFTRVALKTDLPEHRLRRGDVVTVVEYHPGRPDQEPGYSLEVFNAVGDTVAVVTVRECQIEPLTSNELLHVRQLAETAP